ncbi:unnamed protein product [Meganyctiphanes norvegica]|uniref:Uncharacterized protein n=1 Tax=Meganyctiphanes norvegica TaxID=48144 RepID=A0AAV2QED1_MEGNR
MQNNVHAHYAILNEFCAILKYHIAKVVHFPHAGMVNIPHDMVVHVPWLEWVVQVHMCCNVQKDILALDTSLTTASITELTLPRHTKLTILIPPIYNLVC